MGQPEIPFGYQKWKTAAGTCSQRANCDKLVMVGALDLPPLNLFEMETKLCG